MLFVVDKLLWAVLRPSAMLVLLAAGGLLLGGGRPGLRRTLSRAATFAGVGGLVALLLLPIDRWVLRPIEERFPRPAPPAQVDGIIVLGGAIEGLLSADRGLPSLNGGAERMTELMILARRYPQARLAFTGGIGDLVPGATPEADVARALFGAMGLPAERIAYEGLSRTTWENAVRSFALLHPAPGEVWLMVTSASHTPRSVGAFRQAGWRVIAWPVGYKTLPHDRLRDMPGALGERLALLDWAVHEWTGMLVYRLLGRSDALFPAPDAPGA